MRASNWNCGNDRLRPFREAESGMTGIPETVDAFHRGRFHLIQPLGQG
ncbi:methyltransferase, partial [Sinorhizobium meliloti]